MLRRSLLLPLVLGPVALSSMALFPGKNCLAAPARAGTAPLRVVTSFSVLADMVRQLAGNNATVDSLVGPGGDVHEYEPHPSDLEKLARADVVVVNGLGLDRWMNRLIQASGTKAPVIVAGAAVIPRQLPGGITDPHAWQNPQNGILYVKAIAAGLAPFGMALNTEAYIAQIRALDQWCAQQFATIPAARRRIVTSHDAFGYYAARYGLQIMPVRGVENAEPSAQEFAALATRLRAAHGEVVFLENLTNPALLQSLAAETGARVGGTLYADSLSPPDGPAANYLAMIRYNTQTIVTALR